MGRAFKNADAATDLADSLGEQWLDRRAFFYSRRKLVRVTGKTDRPLAGDEKLNQLRMAAVKLHLVERDLFNDLHGLLVALVFGFGQAQE